MRPRDLVRSARPRVLLVEANEDGTVGGSYRSMYNVVAHVDRTRFDPVVCFYQDNEFVQRLRDIEVEVQVLEGFREKERPRRMRRALPLRVAGIGRSIFDRARLLKRWNIALLHLNNSPHVGTLDWLPGGRLARVPVVVSARGDADLAEGMARRAMVRRFDHYIPVSHYMARALLGQGVDASRITTVQNGVDLSALRSRVTRDDRSWLREELGVPPEALLGLMVGNIRHWKGQHVVLEALGLLREDDRPWVIAFAGAEDPGDPSYGRALREQARGLGVEEHVHWLGRRTDVPNLFHAADVGLHASVTPEPFGLVMVECMAVGTPVIAAQEGGGAEIVTDDTGWTYPGGDARALADRLREVGSLSPSEVESRRERARSRADEFDADRMSREIQAVWARLLRFGVASHARPLRGPEHGKTLPARLP